MTTSLWVEPDLGTVSGGLRYNQSLRQALRSQGHGTDVLSLPAESFDGPEGPEALRRHIRRSMPDLVVVDGLIGSAHPELFRLPAAGGEATADVLLVHLPLAAAIEAEGNVDPAAVAKERQAVRAASAVVAVSRWGASELRRRSGRQDIRVAVPGVEVPESLPQKPETQGVTFACVAGLNPLKNHRLLIEALRPLQDHVWHLVLAGPGAETSFGRELLREVEEQLPGRVEYRGVLDAAGVAALWGEADLLLLPSLVETYGMVVTEACAHGVPAFVSEGTGAQEALADGGAALPAEPSRWTDALEDYLTSSASRSQLRAAARRRRADLPTWSEAAAVFAQLSSLRT